MKVMLSFRELRYMQKANLVPKTSLQMPTPVKYYLLVRYFSYFTGNETFNKAPLN